MYQQQQKKQKAHKLMETEQLSTEWKWGQDRSKIYKKLKTFENTVQSRQWIYSIPKLKEHNENNSKRQVYSTTCLHKEVGEISY